MKILVFGGNGMVGSSVVRTLKSLFIDSKEFKSAICSEELDKSDLKVNFHFPQPQIFSQKKVLKDAIKDLSNPLPGLKFNKTNGNSLYSLY